MERSLEKLSLSASKGLDPITNNQLPITVRRLGTTPYEPVWHRMRDFTLARTADTPDELWQVEHPAVYTLGVTAKPEHLPQADNGIPVIRTDRGGQITYHGPGQIVIYTPVGPAPAQSRRARAGAEAGAGGDRIARGISHKCNVTRGCARRLCRRRQNRGAWPAGAQRLLLSRTESEREPGPHTVRHDQSLRLPRA